MEYTPKMIQDLKVKLRKEKWDAVMNTPHSIYCLYCPVDKVIRYIGMTCQPIEQRLINHICEGIDGKSAPERAKWIRSLMFAGHRPKIRTLRIASNRKDAFQLEQRMIQHLRDKRPLVNRILSKEFI